MQSLFVCMDNAWSAEKMYDWGNLGVDNPSWKEGPYISAGANCSQIDRAQPYCLGISQATSALFCYQFGPNPQVSKNGGVSIGQDMARIKANVLIPTVAICMQFALLEAIDIELFTQWTDEQGIDRSIKPAKRYDRIPARSRMEALNALSSNKISNECINAYESVSNFRNKLTHEPQFFCKDAECAIDVHIVCQGISHNIYRAFFGDFQDVQFDYRKPIWSERIGRFNAPIDFL